VSTDSGAPNPSGPDGGQGPAPKKPSGGFFGEKHVRIWTVIAGMAAVAAIPIGLAQLRSDSSPPQSTASPSAEPSSAPSDGPLRLVSLAVQKASKVDADFSGGGATEPKGKINAVAVDITVKNVGTVPTVILAADFDVWYAERLKDCPQSGGGITVSGHYKVKLPEKPPARPFAVTREMRFEVKPGDTERFTFSVGPERNELFASWVGWLYGMDISLRHDESPNPLKLGRVALLSEPGKGKGNYKYSADYDCMAHNGRLVTKLANVPGVVHSEEVDWLAERYRALLAPDPARAREVCADKRADASTLGIKKVCLRYTRRSLDAKVTLTQPPVDGQTRVVLRIRPKGTEDVYTVVSTLTSDPWRPNYFDSDADSPGGDTEIESNRATVSVTPPIDFNHTDLEVSIELQDASDPANPSALDVIPKTDAILVVRGNP